MWLFDNELKKRIQQMDGEIEDLKRTIKNREEAAKIDGEIILKHVQEKQHYSTLYEECRQHNSQLFDQVRLYESPLQQMSPKPSSELEVFLNDLLTKANDGVLIE